MAENETSDKTSAETTGLRGDARTSLVTLAARAWDAKSPVPIVGDARAAVVLEALLRNGHDIGSAQLPPNECQGIAIRTKQFDRWTSAFLKQHSDALIVHLGCGLDTRAERIEWEVGQRWVDVDLPEVIALRKEHITSNLQGRAYCLLEADVTGNSWLDTLPRDKPTAIVMEGLLSYLTEEQSRSLISRLSKHFSYGQICFDCISSTMLNATRKGQIKRIRDIKADLRSAIDDLDQFINVVGGCTKIVEVVRFVEVDGVQLLPMMTRLQMYILSWIPGLRDSARLVRMEFRTAGGLGQANQ